MKRTIGVYYGVSTVDVGGLNARIHIAAGVAALTMPRAEGHFFSIWRVGAGRGRTRATSWVTGWS